MEENKTKGYIYKITNLINDKCYIGQTSKFYKIRWKEHKLNYKQENKEYYNYPLYRAFRKYGIDNFSFEVIEECSLTELNKREIYYIDYYDSFNNGYNQTLGGGGTRKYNFDEIEIIKSYEQLKTIEKVAKSYNCNPQIISSILEKNNIKIKSAIEIAKEKSFNIILLNDDKSTLKTFDSLYLAAKWILENNNPKTNKIYEYAYMVNSQLGLKNRRV